MAQSKVGKIPYSLGTFYKKPSEKGEKLVRAVQQSRQTIDLAALAEHMADHGSTFSSGTILGILKDMVTHIVEFARDGRRVQIDGLGTVYTTLKSDPTEDADQFTAANIVAVMPRMAFAKSLKGALNTEPQFEQVAQRKEQVAALKQTKQTVNEALQDSGSGSGSGSPEADPGDVTP